MSARRFLLFVFATLSLAACKRDASTGAAESLLDSFASSCRSNYGTWTAAALSQTSALKSTLEILKSSQDSACSTASGLLDSVHSLTTELERVAYDDTTQSYLYYKQKEADLIATLAELEGSTASADADLSASLSSDLLSVQLSLLDVESTLSSNGQISTNSNNVTALSNLGLYAQSLLTNAGSLTECYAGAPFMAFQLAASLLAISGGFMTPELGAGFSVLGHLMSSAIDALRTTRLEKAIMEAESTQMQAALGCALESMTELYCDAEASWRLVQLASKSQQKDKWVPTGIWRPIDLVNVRLPVLLSWLQEVRGGVAPPNKTTADYVNSYWDKLFTIQKSGTTIKGIYEEKKAFLNGVTDPTQIDTLTRTALKDVFENLYASDYNNGNPLYHPVYEYFTATSGSEMVCRVLQSPTEFNKDCCKYTDTSGNSGYYGYDSCLQNKFPTIAADIDTLQSRTDDLLTLVEPYVFDLIRKVSNQDTARLVQAAKESELSNYSPIRVMQELSTYFQEIEASPGCVGSRKKLVEETRKAIDAVIVALLNEELDPTKQIEAVYSGFQLKTGTQWVNDRVKDLVRWDVEQRIKRGEVSQDLTQDLLAAGMNIYESLAAAGVSLDQLQLLKDDIDNGQSTAQQNLSTFTKAFRQSFRVALKRLTEAADQAGEPKEPTPGVRRANRGRLARLCTLLMTSNAAWPKGVDIETCRGSVMESVFEGSQLSLSFNDLEKWSTGKPLREKICVFPNYYRAARLYTVDNRDKVQPVIPKGITEAIPATLSGKEAKTGGAKKDKKAK